MNETLITTLKAYLVTLSFCLNVQYVQTIAGLRQGLGLTISPHLLYQFQIKKEYFLD